MNVPFHLFLTVSLLAHAGMLMWQNNREPALHIGGQAQVLQVSVITDHPRKQASVSQPANGQQSTDESALEISRIQPTTTHRYSPQAVLTLEKKTLPSKSTSKTIKANKTVKTANHPDKPLELNPTKHRTGQEYNRRQVSAALRKRLSSHFEYPWLARKRGWQGNVSLSLTIKKDGQLSNYKIATTSGYAVLDKSALNSAKQIIKLPEAIDWLQGDSMELVIPIRYQLAGS